MNKNSSSDASRFETLISYFIHNHDRKHYPQLMTNSKIPYSFHINPNVDYSIVNNQTLLTELITQQLNEKDSVLLKALRLIHQQRQRAGNQTGPYSYVPGKQNFIQEFSKLTLSSVNSLGIIGKPNDYYGMAFMPFAELSIIILVFILWIVSIMACWHKYKKLRVLEPFIPPFNPYPPKRIEESECFKYLLYIKLIG
jgi:hypothetical protein